MRNLLIKLGFIKIDQAEYFNMLKKLTDHMAVRILKEKNLNDAEYKKALCEIKIFFWVFAGPILRENLPDKLLDKTMKFFRNHIIFSSIDELQNSYEYMQNILKTRFQFHENGIQGKGDSIIANNYFTQLKILWFEKPFIDITELRESKVIDFDIFNNLRGQSEIQAMFTHLTPAYSKSLKGLIKITKK